LTDDGKDEAKILNQTKSAPKFGAEGARGRSSNRCQKGMDLMNMGKGEGLIPSRKGRVGSHQLVKEDLQEIERNLTN